jgi:hypothetical protein
MRPSSLIPLVVVAAGCNVRVGRLPISFTTTLRADVHVEPPAPAVAMQGAPVPEFFGVPLDGAQDIVFVLDVSGSMGEAASGPAAQIVVPPPATPPPPPRRGASAQAPAGPNKLDVAKAELIEALQRLPAGTRLDIVFFNSDVAAYAADMVALDETTRTHLVGFVTSQQSGGSTALTPAMRAAFLMNAKRVVLLSDGIGNTGGGPGTVLHDAREAIHGGVRIDTVGLGKDQDVALMSALANESGGVYQAL